MRTHSPRRPSLRRIGLLSGLVLLLGAPALVAAPAQAQLPAAAPGAEPSTGPATVSVVEHLEVDLESPRTPAADPSVSDPPAPPPSGAQPGRSTSEEPPGTTPAPLPEPSTTVPAPVAPAPEADTASVARTDLEQFRMIGVSVVATDQDAEARIRVQGEDGWREWMDLEWEGQKGPDPGSAEADRAATGVRLSSSPIWIDQANGFEIELAAGTVSPRVLLVRDEVATDTSLTEPVTAVSIPGRYTPSINLRGSWGARSPRVQPSIAANVRISVVHHTVSQNAYAPGDVPSLLRSVQAFHMDGNGWDDIGYNFLVDRFGRIWEGRAGGTTNAVIGAHAAGVNTFATGVSVIGNFEVQSPPQEVIVGLGEILGWKLFVHGVDARANVDFRLGSGALGAGQVRNFPTIIGHRDVAQTACPGVYLYGLLPTVRAWAGGYQDAMRASQGFWSSVTIGTNQDGRLELFAIGNDGQAYHNWQVFGGWSGWRAMGGRFAGRLAVANNADGRLEVFGITVGGRLAHAWQIVPNGGWSGFALEGGSWSPDSGVGVARAGSGRLEAVVMGNDQAYVFWQVAPNGSWNGAAPIGGSFPSNANVSVGVNQDGRLEAFAISDGGVLSHAWQRGSGGWARFTSLGMPVSGRPSVARNADGRLEVVGVDAGGTMWQVWQKAPNGIWSAPKALSGGFAPAADAKLARNQDGRLQAFSLDVAGGLVSSWQTVAGGGWHPIRGFGGRLMGTVDAALGADGRMALVSFTSPFADRAWMLTQNAPNGAWGVWSPIP